VARLCFGLLQSAKRETSGRVVGILGSGAAGIARKIAGELGKLPPEVQRLVQMQWSRSKPYWSMSKYLRALPSCAGEVIDCAIPKNIPVTVISGMHQPRERLKEHVAIAEHSMQGNHIVAEKSGHWIQFDEPELILNAVRQMVTAHKTSSAAKAEEPASSEKI
jgi:pimeloyl-ACP methyl ester carboxylesterase